MSGNRYLLDTNAVITIINGNEPLLKMVNSADFVCLSVISVIEFLSFPGIKENDKQLLYGFISELEVVDLTIDNTILLNIISQIRSSKKIKLPDAIIAATAIYQQATLITNDKGFSKVAELTILNY